MQRQIFQYIVLAGVILLMGLPGVGLAEPRVDQSAYAPLLKAHVRDGIVDYKGFKENESRLDTYLRVLSEVDPDRLERDERMAFYINAYNAWTIKLILTKYPDLKSIKDLGTVFQSPWKKKFVKLNGHKVTLDHIEHEILRPRFKDPRIHFAVNCASISCPPLLAEPYSGDRLEEQLESVTEAFINDPQSNFVKGGTLHVSKIFKWFGEDFDGDIDGFFEKYARQDLARQLESAGSKLKIKYLHYDWSLNGM